MSSEKSDIKSLKTYNKYVMKRVTYKVYMYTINAHQTK